MERKHEETYMRYRMKFRAKWTKVHFAWSKHRMKNREVSLSNLGNH